MSNMFQKAERKQAKLKLAVTGPSGAGKTWTALMLASALGGKIAVVDTENGSASLYADKYEFDTLNLTPPYETERYIEAIQDAEKAGYEVLVLDSISHAWSGEGGLLDQKEAMDARGGNSYTNWGKITPKHNAFLSRILNAGVHIVATMRSKQDYVLQDNGKGKQAPVKVGMAPVQREGMEYEFTTIFDMDMSHRALASKDRTGLFSSTSPMPMDASVGAKLTKWLSEGAPEKKTTTEPSSAVVEQIADSTPSEGEKKPVAMDDETLGKWFAYFTLEAEKGNLVDAWKSNYHTLQEACTPEQMDKLTIKKDELKEVNAKALESN